MSKVTNQDLVALLVAERARNAQPAAPVAQGLPQLTPAMLLSAAATREVKYAQQLQGFVPRAPMAEDAYLNALVADASGVVPLSVTPTTMQFAVPTSRIEVPPGPVTTDTVQLRAGSGHTVAELEKLWVGSEGPEADHGWQQDNNALAGLWDHTVPAGAHEHATFRQEVHAEFSQPTPGAFVSESDIQFDNDLDSELAAHVGAPNEAVRFRVGRDDPPARRPINRQAQVMDGQVVSQRGTDGSFRAVPRPSMTERLASPPVPPSTHRRYVPAPASPARPVDRSSIPTAWERLGNDDF